jgi:hypothetical protein
MFTLLLYVVIEGKMHTTRLPMSGLAACQAAAAQLAETMRPIHHECRPKRAPKKGE